MEHNQEISGNPNAMIVHEPSPFTDDAIIRIAETADEKLAAYAKIKQTALKITNEQDWVDQNGKPYLQSTGAEKIARLFGISWRFLGDPAKVPIGDKDHYRYDVKMEMEMAGKTIEVIGSRSSDDTFFTVYYDLPFITVDGKKKKTKYYRPGSEVDSANVLKAAITNAVGNGIVKFLGLRNLTWEEVKNIDRSKVTGIDYDGKNVRAKPGEKPPKPQPQPTSSQTETSDGNGKDKPCTKPQQEAIHKMLGFLKITDDMAKMEKVSKIAGRKGVITNLMALNIGEASEVIKQLGVDIDEMKAAQSEESETNGGE